MDRREIVPVGGTANGGDAEAWAPTRGETHLPETFEDDQESDKLGPEEDWLFWNRNIRAGLTHENRWRLEALQSERLYFGPDDDPGKGTTPDHQKSVNEIGDKVALIHANIDVLAPLIYSDTPQPIVRRRFYGDGKTDEVALMAAEVGQRLADFLIDDSDFDTAMEQARDNWLIAGRASARVIYRADVQVQQVQTTLGVVPMPVKQSESVAVRTPKWSRVVFAPCDSWEDCAWMAIEVPMTRKKVSDRFGEEKAGRMSYNQQGLSEAQRGRTDEDRDRGVMSLVADTETGEQTASPFDTCNVWEIWSRETKEVIWWSQDCHGEVLDRIDDPLGLEHFYPTPRPLTATTKGATLIPRPDIAYYERRAIEVEKASEKIKSLLNVISVSGLFPGSMQEEINGLLTGRNRMIPVAQWMALLEKGGSTGIIQWLPLEAIIAALNALIIMREQAKQAMFEASGVSDVMRAASDPDETATAQQIKGRYAGLRLSKRQRTMAIFARDTIRIMLEVALEHFDTATIADICGLDMPMTEAERVQIVAQAQAAEMQYQALAQQHQAMQQAAQAGVIQGPLPPPPEPPAKVPPTSWEAVHERLRTDFGRKITIMIETQSTVLADEQADKEARVEFLNAFAAFVGETMPLVKSGAFDMKTAKEILLFGVRGFPKSRTLESMIASLPDDMEMQPEVDTQVQVANIRAEVDKMLKEMDLADRKADRAHEKEIKRMDIGGKLVDTAADAAMNPPPPPQPKEPA